MSKVDFSKIFGLLINHAKQVEAVIKEVQEAINTPTVKEEAEAVASVATLVAEVADEVDGK